MKNALLLLAAILWVVAANAQTETLFGKAKVVGGFGAPIYEVGLNNKLGVSVGGGGGVVINSFFIGAYGLGSTDFTGLVNGQHDIKKLDIGHGGLWLGFAFPSRRLIHLYTSARIGWGAVDVNFNDPQLDFRDVDQIFVATPEIGLELNIARWLRVAGTAGYRFVNGTRTNTSYSDKTFSGGIAGVTVRIGGFGRNR